MFWQAGRCYPAGIDRPTLSLLAVGVPLVGLLLGGVWTMQADARYRATLASEPRYTLPHQRFSYGSTARDVQLVASDGVTLAGTLLGASHDVGVILYPSFVAGRHGFAVVTMADWLSRGLAVLVVQPRGVGRSQGVQGPGGGGRLDLLAGAAYLRSRGIERVGVLAEGDSTVPATMAAVGQHGAIDALALAGPVGYWGEPVAGEAYAESPLSGFGRLFWQWTAGIRLGSGKSPRMADLVGHLSPLPVLFIGSQDDPTRTASQLYLAAAEPRSLSLLPGSGLPCGWSAFPEYFETVREWFHLALEATASDAVTASGAAAGPPGAQAPDSVLASDSVAWSSGSGQMVPAATETPRNMLPQMLAEPQPIVPPLPTWPPSAPPPARGPLVPVAPALPPGQSSGNNAR